MEGMGRDVIRDATPSAAWRDWG